MDLSKIISVVLVIVISTANGLVEESAAGAVVVRKSVLYLVSYIYFLRISK